MSTSKLLDSLGTEMRKNATATIIFHQTIGTKLGLNPTDHKCLEIILNNEPATAGMIAEFTGLTTGAVTGVLDRLEKGDFIFRENDPTDRRRTFVKANKNKAKEAISPLFESLGEEINKILLSYNEQELQFLEDFYKKNKWITGRRESKINEKIKSLSLSLLNVARKRLLIQKLLFNIMPRLSKSFVTFVMESRVSDILYVGFGQEPPALPL